MARHTLRSLQRGVALVEFALMVPFLLMLTFITTEFGRALYQYNVVVKSVRDAARYLSTQTPNTQQARAANMIVYGNPDGTGNPLALGLTTAHVQPPVWSTAGVNPVINTVTVRVSGYTFTPLMGRAFWVDLPSITFSDITATMRSYL